MERKKTKFIIGVVKWIFIYLMIASLGFILGMIYQQLLFTQEIGKVLSYTNIQINFNETKFIEELNNTFIPAWKTAFNETIHNQINITNT